MQWLGSLALLWSLSSVQAAGHEAASHAAQARVTDPALVFGIVPQQSALKLARDWGPLLEELSRQSGVPVRFATAPDIPTFEQRVEEGAYDVAYMNPYHYVVFHEQIGVEPLARAADQRLEGIIVTGREAMPDDIGDLDGSDLAFPAPAAFAATLVVQSSLRQADIDFRSHFVSSHDAVYRSVAAGRFVAGGGINRTFEALPDSIREQLRVLWVSPGYTPHAIAVHPRVPLATREALTAALVEMGRRSAGRELLAPLRITGFVAAKDSDWDDVRDLEIETVLGTQEP
ncbi:PhnD/SsuA/transferrin family substrate-binding protein [Halomonas sp. D1-1]|uniref:PhnD/SsuA/transferrin family substrate-binding protein n=2 Tax=Halomonas icarae TaxID=2691040 RepID=A0A7X5AK76_9GAMM|nr:PhnD/SsuA/transferrin family substrate-binding protein [Halomonas icarae]